MFDEKPPLPEKKQTQSQPLRGKYSWVKLVIFTALSLVGLGAVGGGLYFLINFSQTSCASESSTTQASKPAATSQFLGKIYVDLGGAVKEPGLQQLDFGSRLAMVIDQAGGFSDQADQDFVTQELNLAQKLQDGDKIYIPSQAERDYEQAVTEFCQQQDLPGPGSADSAPSDGQISINTASQEKLIRLPGIGEKRAQDIIDGRPYVSLAELLDKEVLTQKIYDDIINQLKL